MKKKSLIALVSTTFALTAIAVTGSMVLSNSNLLRIARANPTSVGSYTITKDNFGEGGNVNFVVGGETWYANGVSFDGNKVVISGTFYTGTYSGSSVSYGRRGNGYTSFAFSGLDTSSAVGLVFHLKDVDGHLTETANQVSADVDLTAITTANRRRGMEFVQGNPSSFSFTSLTLNYECCDVAPTVEIQETSLSVGVGQDGNLTTKNSDVYAGDTVSYAWVSDDTGVLTVAGNGANATVHGVSAGSATVTVTMTVNGQPYNDTLEVTVTATAATVKEMTVLDTSYIQGAGVFCKFNPSSTKTTAALLDTYTSSVTLDFAASTDNAINHYVLQDKGDDSYTAYVVCDSAVGLNSAFTMTVEFKDNPNNVIYRASFYYDEGALAKPIKLSYASDEIVVGTPAQLTANKGFYLEGEPTFSFVSDNTSVLTVSANNNVCTLTGVAAGSAKVTVTMTIGGDEYVREQVFTVSSNVTEVPLVITGATWGGSGCQFFTDMSFANTEGTWQLSDYNVKVTVTGAGFAYSGVGACLQASAVYLTFTGAPGENDEFTVKCELGRASKVYSFTVGFNGTDMVTD